jgi:hypothetical protein
MPDDDRKIDIRHFLLRDKQSGTQENLEPRFANR